MITKICTETFDKPYASSLSTYMRLDGYKSWENIVKNKIPRTEIISQIKDSGLRGKGGAGFLPG